MIEETFCVIQGTITKGFAIYGPFNTVQEALDYGGKNFPDDTREIAVMRKETETYG